MANEALKQAVVQWVSEELTRQAWYNDSAMLAPVLAAYQLQHVADVLRTLGVRVVSDLEFLDPAEAALSSFAPQDVDRLLRLSTCKDVLGLNVHIRQSHEPVAHATLPGCPPFITLNNLAEIIRMAPCWPSSLGITVLYLHDNQWIRADRESTGSTRWIDLRAPRQVVVDISPLAQPSSPESLGQHAPAINPAPVTADAFGATREYVDLSWLDKTPSAHTDLREVPKRQRGQGAPVTSEIDYFLVDSFARSELTSLAQTDRVLSKSQHAQGFSIEKAFIIDDLRELIRHHYVATNQRLPPFFIDEAITIKGGRLDSYVAFNEAYTRPVTNIDPEVVTGPYLYQQKACYVDFANKRIGGGFLGCGLVQEEILVMEFTDMFMALCQGYLYKTQFLESEYTIQDNEAFLITNLRRYAQFDYYARLPQDWRACTHLTPDPSTTQPIAFVIIDAMKKPYDYTVYELLWHLRKAYIGFRMAKDDGFDLVVTGGWGCGAFGNSLIVMFLIQLLAANMAGIGMRFHAYLQSDLDALRNVRQKYAVDAFLQQHPTPSSVIEFILNLVQAKSSEFLPVGGVKSAFRAPIVPPRNWKVMGSTTQLQPSSLGHQPSGTTQCEQAPIPPEMTAMSSSQPVGHPTSLRVPHGTAVADQYAYPPAAEQSTLVNLDRNLDVILAQLQALRIQLSDNYALGADDLQQQQLAQLSQGISMLEPLLMESSNPALHQKFADAKAQYTQLIHQLQMIHTTPSLQQTSASPSYAPSTASYHYLLWVDTLPQGFPMSLPEIQMSLSSIFGADKVEILRHVGVVMMTVPQPQESLEFSLKRVPLRLEPLDPLRSFNIRFVPYTSGNGEPYASHKEQFREWVQAVTLESLIAVDWDPDTSTLEVNGCSLFGLDKLLAEAAAVPLAGCFSNFAKTVFLEDVPREISSERLLSAVLAHWNISNHAVVNFRRDSFTPVHGTIHSSETGIFIYSLVIVDKAAFGQIQSAASTVCLGNDVRIETSFTRRPIAYIHTQQEGSDWGCAVNTAPAIQAQYPDGISSLKVCADQVHVKIVATSFDALRALVIKGMLKVGSSRLDAFVPKPISSDSQLVEQVPASSTKQESIKQLVSQVTALTDGYDGNLQLILERLGPLRRSLPETPRQLGAVLDALQVSDSTTDVTSGAISSSGAAVLRYLETLAEVVQHSLHSSQSSPQAFALQRFASGFLVSNVQPLFACTSVTVRDDDFLQLTTTNQLLVCAVGATVNTGSADSQESDLLIRTDLGAALNTDARRLATRTTTSVGGIVAPESPEVYPIGNNNLDKIGGDADSTVIVLSSLSCLRGPKEQGYKWLEQMTPLAVLCASPFRVHPGRIPAADFVPYTRRKIEAIFEVAAGLGYHSLLLPLFGCDNATFNPPAVVAEIFAAVILQYGGYFRDITFLTRHASPAAQEVFRSKFIGTSVPRAKRDPQEHYKGLPLVPTTDNSAGQTTVCPDGGFCAELLRGPGVLGATHAHMRHPPRCPFGADCEQNHTNPLHKALFDHGPVCEREGNCKLAARGDQAHNSNFQHPPRCCEWYSCHIVDEYHLRVRLHPLPCNPCVQHHEFCTVTRQQRQPTPCPDGYSCRRYTDPDHFVRHVHPFNPPCTDLLHCNDMNDSHRRSFSHICRWGMQCINLNDPDHCQQSVHILRPRCPEEIVGSGCHSLTSEYHLSYFSHTGIPDIRPLCTTAMCTQQIRDPGHVTRFSHPWPKLDAVPVRNHTKDIDFERNHTRMVATIQAFRVSENKPPITVDQEILDVVRNLRPAHRCKPDILKAILQSGNLLSRDTLTQTDRHDKVFSLISCNANLQSYIDSQAPAHKPIVQYYVREVIELLFEGKPVENTKTEPLLQKRLSQQVIDTIRQIVSDVVTNSQTFKDNPPGIGWKGDTELGTNRNVFSIVGPNHGWYYGDVVLILKRNLMAHPDFEATLTAATTFKSGRASQICRWLPEYTHTVHDQAMLMFNDCKMNAGFDGFASTIAMALVEQLLRSGKPATCTELARLWYHRNPHFVVEGRLPSVIPVSMIEEVIIPRDIYEYLPSQCHAVLDRILPKDKIIITQPIGGPEEWAKCKETKDKQIDDVTAANQGRVHLRTVAHERGLADSASVDDIPRGLCFTLHERDFAVLPVRIETGVECHIYFRARNTPITLFLSSLCPSSRNDDVVRGQNILIYTRLRRREKPAYSYIAMGRQPSDHGSIKTDIRLHRKLEKAVAMQQFGRCFRHDDVVDYHIRVNISQGTVSLGFSGPSALYCGDKLEFQDADLVSFKYLQYVCIGVGKQHVTVADFRVRTSAEPVPELPKPGSMPTVATVSNPPSDLASSLKRTSSQRTLPHLSSEVDLAVFAQQPLSAKAPFGFETRQTLQGTTQDIAAQWSWWRFGTFEPYSAEINQQIERAYQVWQQDKSPSTQRPLIATQDGMLIVDFVTYTQAQQGTPNKTRPIRRRAADGTGVTVPSLGNFALASSSLAPINETSDTLPQGSSVPTFQPSTTTVPSQPVISSLYSTGDAPQFKLTSQPLWQQQYHQRQHQPQQLPQQLPQHPQQPQHHQPPQPQRNHQLQQHQHDQALQLQPPAQAGAAHFPVNIVGVPASGVVWQWQSDTQRNQFDPYPQDVSAAVEEAYLKYKAGNGPEKVAVMIGTKELVISLEGMKQFDPKTPNRRRLVRRVGGGPA